MTLERWIRRMLGLPERPAPHVVAVPGQSKANHTTMPEIRATAKAHAETLRQADNALEREARLRGLDLRAPIRRAHR